VGERIWEVADFEQKMQPGQEFEVCLYASDFHVSDVSPGSWEEVDMAEETGVEHCFRVQGYEAWLEDFSTSKTGKLS